MKKKMLGIIAFAAIAAVAGWNYNQNMNNVNLSDLAIDTIESLAACESIGWWDNNGNCVVNDSKVYFCKSDSMFEFTDCLQ